jgi:hypothetical protein
LCVAGRCETPVKTAQGSAEGRKRGFRKETYLTLSVLPMVN